jgi:epoxyqueuosine reductase
MSRVRRLQGRFREGGRLTEPWSEAVRLARAAGFLLAGFTDPSRLAPFARRIERLREKGWYKAAALEGMELDWILHPEKWAPDRSILVCAMSCFRREPDDLSLPADPHALIAAFARRNHYAAAARTLSRLLAPLAARLGIPRSRIRIFSNSRIPEKPLLAAAGLASFGANGLAIAPGLGSRFIIAGAVLPSAIERSEVGGAPDGERDPCGSCAKCAASCPVGAIVERGLVDPDRCISGLASRESVLSPEAREAWGRRLYGCQECQRVCPHNAPACPESGVGEGDVGPSVSLARILSMDPPQVRSAFRETAMGMSWVSPIALIRNALIAAGNSGEPSLYKAVARHAESSEGILRDAARWALERLTG